MPNTPNSTVRVAKKYAAISRRKHRWDEYAVYLRQAQAAGYDIVPLHEWATEASSDSERTLVLRHDVDDFPAGASRLSDVEHRLGLRSTFYFRWCTFDTGAIRHVMRNGSGVGLHYETLTRYAFENGLTTPQAITHHVIATCRATLEQEISRFKQAIGECDSVTAHGDFRRDLIGCSNKVLLTDQNCGQYGIKWSADDPALEARIGRYVVDGDGFPVAWRADMSLPGAVEEGQGVILFNSHPHHWARGARVVSARVLEQARFVARHPLTWERGKPEAFAWHRHQCQS